MNQFLALLRLELSQWRTALSVGSNGRGQKKDRKLSRAAAVLILVVIVAVYLIYFEIQALSLLQIAGTPELLLKMLVFLSMIMTLMTGLMQVMSSLYFSRDIPVLSYLPASSTKMYAARICALLAEEIAICALFVLPGSILYMIRLGFDIGLLFRALLVTVVSPVIPVCIVTMLAGLITRIPGFWKHRELIMTIFTVLMVLMSAGLSFLMGSVGGDSAAGGEDLAQTIEALTNAMNGSITRLAPMRWCANGLAYGGVDLIWAVAVSGVSLALICLIWGPSYLRTASRGTETGAEGKAVDLQNVKLQSNSPMKALVLREIREMVRTPAYFTNGLLISLIMPTMLLGIMLLSLNMNLEGGIGVMLAEIDPEGSYRVVLAAALTALMGMLLGMNSAAATAVSREGTRHALFRSLPVSSGTILQSKLFMALFFHWIGLIPACILAAVLIPHFAGYALLMLLWGMLLAFIGTCLGLTLDVKKPRLDWINETQAIKSGFNQLISLLIYLAILIVLGLGSGLLVFMAGISMPVYAVLLTAVLILFSILAGLWLRRQASVYEATGD